MPIVCITPVLGHAVGSRLPLPRDWVLLDVTAPHLHALSDQSKQTSQSMDQGTKQLQTIPEDTAAAQQASQTSTAEQHSNSPAGSTAVGLALMYVLGLAELGSQWFQQRRPGGGCFAV